MVVLGVFLLVLAVIIWRSKDTDGVLSTAKKVAGVVLFLDGLVVGDRPIQSDTKLPPIAASEEPAGRAIEEDDWFNQLSADTSYAKIKAQEIYMKGYKLWNIEYGGYDSAETALQYFTESIAQFPTAEALNASGQVKVQLGKVREAGEDYNQAIELNPEYGPAYFNRGALFFILDDKGHACLDWEKANSLGLPQASQALAIYCGVN